MSTDQTPDGPAPSRADQQAERLAEAERYFNELDGGPGERVCALLDELERLRADAAGPEREPAAALDARQVAATPTLLAMCDEAERMHNPARHGGRMPFLTTREVRYAIAAAGPQSEPAAVPNGEDVPARLDAAADTLAEHDRPDLAALLRGFVIRLERDDVLPEVRAAVAAALAGPAPARDPELERLRHDVEDAATSWVRTFRAPWLRDAVAQLAEYRAAHPAEQAPAPDEPAPLPDAVQAVVAAARAYADSTAEPTDTPHEDALLDAVRAFDEQAGGGRR